jgi:hypothetical protein
MMGFRRPRLGCFTTFASMTMSLPIICCGASMDTSTSMAFVRLPGAGHSSSASRTCHIRPFAAFQCRSRYGKSGRCAGERRTSTDQRWYFRVRMWALRPKAGTDRVTRIAKAQIRTRPGALPLIQRQPQIAPPQSSRKFNPAS